MNNFDKLNVLNYCNDKFKTSIEIIDVDKLNFICKNPDIFKDKLIKPKHKPLTSYEPLLLAQLYLEKSRKGEVIVDYRQKIGCGRYNAMGSMSLQCMNRRISHTIAKNDYIDVDIKNCHPNILKFICNSLNIKCKILTSYCEDRDKFAKDNNIELDKLKQVMISIINGGSKDLYEYIDELKQIDNDEIDEFIKNLDKCQLKKFKTKEMPKIFKKIINYSTLKDKYNNHFEKRKLEEVKFEGNDEGTFLSAILNDIENKILDVMIEYFNNGNNDVLCFDGIMLYSKNLVSLSDIENKLKLCSEYIKSKLSIDLKLAIKPQENGFDLSEYKIDKYKEKSNEYYSDYVENFINKDIDIELLEEWSKCIVIIENGGKKHLRTKNLHYDVLTKEKTIEWQDVSKGCLRDALNVSCNIKNKYYDYEFSTEFYANNTTKYKQDKAMVKMTDEEKLKLVRYSYTELSDPCKNSIAWLEYSIKKGKLVSYSKIDYIPYLARLNDDYNCKELRIFNLFSGFPLENIKIKEIIPFEKSIIYKFMFEDLCSSDNGEFNHLLDHIADMIQDAIHIKSQAHLFFGGQGIGKSFTGKFVSRLVGSSNSITLTNTEAYFNNFNSNQTHKILKIFEEIKTKGEAFKQADRLKGEISIDKERVEPKGVNAYEVRHCARFWFFTNNENSLYIEKDDRRFTMHKMNNIHANDEDYFNPLWELLDDENFMANAFEYFATRKYTKKTVNFCYDTPYKKSQKLVNLPNAQKFIIEMAEANLKDLPLDKNKISIEGLNDTYKLWSEKNNLKYCKASFSTQFKQLEIEAKTLKYKGKSAKCYTLTMDILLGSFRNLLKDKKFEFDIITNESYDNDDEIVNNLINPFDSDDE